MALRPPLPSSGNSLDGPVAYQISAGRGGGSFLRPVLLRDRLTGFFRSQGGPTFLVAKSYWLNGSFGPVQSGQPKLPAFGAWLISSYPSGAMPVCGSTLGPTSPK